MQAWFVSDIHIKNLNERNSQKLLRFLHSLSSREVPATHLFLVGDIFDLWISDGSVFVRKFQPIVEAIIAVKKAGILVTYFEGNHDVHVKHFWQEKLGIPTFVDEEFFQLGTWKVRVEHGDMINPDDKAYMRYRGFIRQPFMEKLAPYISNGMDKIGQWMSKTSRRKSTVKRQVNEEKLRQMIRKYAQDVYSREYFNLIVTGHMHIQDDFTFEKDGKKIRSINLGSWFDGPKALCLNDSELKFVDLN